MHSPRVQVRKGQAPDMMDREAFGRQFRHRFFDPAFDREREALGRIEVIAWEAYQQGRKSGRARAAGPGFADPKFELSEEWLATRARLAAAQKRWGEAATPSRVLVVAGASRNDGTCPGEMSKTWRLAQVAREALAGDSGQGGIDVDVLDLSHLASDYAHHIHPCKGCVSTAMPLCHWPCSCYPNHALGQTGDWMGEIYERWVAAHGVLVVTPVYWYQVASPLKLMMDRLVCADGGNPDPTRTGGKDPAKAKEIELAGWPYPKHLAGRAYGVVVHGDVAGIEGVRRALCDWLDWMGLVDAGAQARLDRFIGYYAPYATSHDTLDADIAVQEEVRNVARALVQAVGEVRKGTLSRPDAKLKAPRPK
ncbi:MAG: flavodoxin family protein [Burkholderiaceae bacterium]|nr:flavodoxin family protein [Burkholderiaceae bacterium]